MKNIYLIIGKSGSGKSTITRELCVRYNYKEVQSYTERPKRYPDEKGHIFITSDEFDKLNDLCAYTVFNGNRYGVPSELVDNNDLYVIDVIGAKYMFEHYHGIKSIKVIGIINDEDYETDKALCAYHMLMRGDDAKSIVARLVNDDTMFKDFYNILDFIAVNKSVDLVCKDIKNFIDRCEQE